MGDPIRTISLDDLDDLAVGLDRPATPEGGKAVRTSQDSVAGSQQPPNPFGGVKKAERVDTEVRLAPGVEDQARSETRMMQLFGKVGQLQGSRRKPILVLLLLGLVGAGVAMLIGDVGEGLYEQFFGSEVQLPQPNELTKKLAIKKAKLAAQNKLAEASSDDQESSKDPATADQAGPGKRLIPYWGLPNPLERGPDLAARGVLSLGNEELWRFGIKGKSALRYDSYLRFQTVKDIRRSRVIGSEPLLREALNLPKFWARMEALLALTELGVEADIETVQKAIGKTRRSLVKNYFKRFGKAANSAEIHVMRQAIRIVDAPARLVILKKLALRRDAVNDLYLYAGRFDRNSKIVAWSTLILPKHSLSADQEQKMKTLISASRAGVGSKRVVGAPQSTEPNPKEVEGEELPQEIEVEKVYFFEENNEPAQPQLGLDGELDDGFSTLLQ